MITLKLINKLKPDAKLQIFDAISKLDEREFLKIESNVNFEPILEELRMNSVTGLEWIILEESELAWIAMLSDAGGLGRCGGK